MAESRQLGIPNWKAIKRVQSFTLVWMALEVTVALFAAIRAKSVALIVGHTIPREDKAELIKLVRSHNHTRILSLRRHGDAAVTGADHSLESALGPDALLEAVKIVLNGRGRSDTALSDSLNC